MMKNPPTIAKPFPKKDTVFFVDFSGHETDSDVQEALKDVGKKAAELKRTNKYYARVVKSASASGYKVYARAATIWD